jgi:hypothetical protein
VKKPYVADVLLLDGLTFGATEKSRIRAVLEETPKKKKEIDERKARLHDLLIGLASSPFRGRKQPPRNQ